VVKPAPLGPAFANIFTANLASSLGDGIARIAIPLLAARLTDDPLLIALVAALMLLPWLFFAIPAGILIDRIDRRVALAMAQAVRTVLGVVLFALVLTDELTIWWLYLVIFVYGTFETVYDGAIRAVVPSVVGPADLPRANSRVEGAEQVVQNFLSGPLTSALFALSALIPLGINGLVFALAGGLALLLPKAASGRQFAEARDVAPWYRQVADGLRFLRGHRMLRTLWLFSTAIGLLHSAAVASFVLFVLDRLAVPEALFGVFMLSGAAGGLVGAVLADRLKSLWGTGLTMAVMNLASVLALVLIGAVPVVWVSAAGYFVSAFGVTVWNVLVMSLRQTMIPGRLLGRVHGTWRTLLWGTMPLGALIGGLIGRVDLALPFLLGGGLATVLALVFFRFLTTLPNPEDVEPPVEPGPTDPATRD
jgi:hypothetical protein